MTAGEDDPIDLHGRSGHRDRAAIVRAAVDKGCAKLAGLCSAAEDIQIDCPDRAAVGLVVAGSGAAYKHDRRLLPAGVINAVDRHLGSLGRIDRAAIAGRTVLHRGAAVDDQSARIGLDQPAVARLGRLIVAAIQRDVFELEGGPGIVEIKQLRSAGSAGDGADRAVGPPVGVLRIRRFRRGQGDVRGGEIGDRVILADDVIFHQHLDVDRGPAGDAGEIIQGLSQRLIDRVSAVRPREGVSLRVRDLADIGAPVDIGVAAYFAAVKLAVPIVEKAVQIVAAAEGAEFLPLQTVFRITVALIRHIDADFRVSLQAVGCGLDRREVVVLHENVVLESGVDTASVIEHLHVALKVQRTAVDGAVFDGGDRVAGDAEIAGEGRLIFHIDRAALPSLTAGDAAAGDRGGLRAVLA